MATNSIQRYYQEVEKLKHRGGTKMESTVSQAFYTLLNDYAQQKELMLVPQVWVKGKLGRKVKPDGTLKDSLRQDWGYWESKDEADDIDEEIEKKFAKGYPDVNILFEDSNTVVLIQSGNEMMRASVSDADKFDAILKAFVSYQRPEVETFRKAIELFKADVPDVAETLRNVMAQAEKHNKFYVEERDEFFELCKEAINPQVTLGDITEMMIQHILTADIFNTVFDEPYFHRENNVAKALEKVVDTFFIADVRKKTLNRIQHYYQAINAAAAGIADHHEKQKFLKAVYETFYKSYNPKAADRLGVVYTPNEIVRFMVESTDYLLHKHFGKFLEDKNVEILDPATGTGTFICDIIDHIRTDKLEYKYKNELHANEVAILPYYIANLNIEFTYKQKMEQYAEFQNLCFVDTLDNMGFGYKGKQEGLFSFSAENVERIRRQNKKKISVIIGNPPYNANQMNENESNKNREYWENPTKKTGGIDGRIKETFIKYSKAQKTKAYDMYSRFYRWAMDRIGDDGLICFITNNSFINSITFDGFRASVQKEFQYAYIIDLGGNIRELSGKDGISLNERHTIFGTAAAVGIAIGIFLKDSRRSKEDCTIKYIHPCDIRATREEKLEYLSSHRFEKINFENVQPDQNNNWINITDNDWDSLIPLVSKDTKQTKRKIEEAAVFKLFSLGVITARDEWVYDWNEEDLIKKIRYLIRVYNQNVKKLTGSKRSEVSDEVNYKIKWSRAVKNDLVKGRQYSFKKNEIVSCLFRPFVKYHLYFAKELNEMQYQLNSIFYDEERKSPLIAVLSMASANELSCLCTDKIFDAGLLKKWNGMTTSFPLYRYSDNGTRMDNITDWGLEQFRKKYATTPNPLLSKEGTFRRSSSEQGRSKHPENIPKVTPITKEDIFHYVYAVLHNPAYRKKYEINLKREFPRIPLYDDFWKWAEWGKQLMDLHVNYEKAKGYALKSVGAIHESPNNKADGHPPKSRTQRVVSLRAKLKADKDNGAIIIDDETTLTGIPKEAWEYKLGNRSALEWVLDQHKESTPSDPTIAEKFNTYKFADYKKEVIELLKHVTTVSVETMKIIREMEKK